MSDIDQSQVCNTNSCDDKPIINTNLDGGVQQILVKGIFFGTRVAIPQSQHKPKHGPHKKRKRIDESECVNDENGSRRKSNRIKRHVSRYQ